MGIDCNQDIVYIGRMNTDAKLIYDLGGPTKVAKMLGYGKGGTQRVWNWTKNGIPAAVKLERPDLFVPDLASRMRTI